MTESPRRILALIHADSTDANEAVSVLTAAMTVAALGPASCEVVLLTSGDIEAPIVAALESANKIWQVAHPRLPTTPTADQLVAAFTLALTHPLLTLDSSPYLALTSPGTLGEELAARLAARLNGAALGRCSLITPNQHRLHVQRPAYGTRATLTLDTHHPRCFATLRLERPGAPATERIPAAERVLVELSGTPDGGCPDREHPDREQLNLDTHHPRCFATLGVERPGAPVTERIPAAERVLVELSGTPAGGCPNQAGRGCPNQALNRVGGCPDRADRANRVAERIAVELSGELPVARSMRVQPHAGKERPLEGAKIVVAGGRGMGGEAGFAVLAQLADSLGASLAGSLPTVDAGWIPVSRQVGQSGKYVSPEVYVAVGISGTPQHLAGVARGTRIVAINNDPQADIFAVAEIGVVADWKEFVPRLTAELAKSE